MKNVILDEIKNELNLKEMNINNIDLKCYYNICRYYNKDIKIIEEYQSHNLQITPKLPKFENFQSKT